MLLTRQGREQAERRHDQYRTYDHHAGEASIHFEAVGRGLRAVVRRAR